MARPTLAITLEVDSTCEELLLNDTTANYGAPTVTLNSVTGLVVVLNYSDGSYLTFTFTIVNQVITACTLGVSGATATAITSELESTVWPLVDFNFFFDYGVDVPEFTDMVYTADYTITGGSGDTAFSYTTSATIVRTCDVCCCITESFQAVDPNCIDEDCLFKKIMADTYLKIAGFSANVGNTDRAQLALTKAIDMCNCECEDC